MRNLSFLFFLFIFATNPAYSQDTIHVPADYLTIQAGIDAAQNGNIVLVDDGTYLENINFKGKAITVASNFIIDGDTNHISNTLIDGSQPSNPDTASVVLFINGEDTTSILCGFTITGGSGTLNSLQTNRRGGGVFCYQSGARIKYNIIENNEIIHQDSARGGGICEANESSDPHFSYVIVEYNKIRNNRCESNDNKAFGGGVYLQGEGRIVGNQIINNEVEYNGVLGSGRLSSGGGIACGWWAGGYASVKIYDNLIANNRALSNNSAAYCGGVDLIHTNCDFRRNTVKDNQVSSAPYAYGGGMRVLDSSPTSFVVDNDFINNGPLDASVMVQGAGLLTVRTNNLTVENNVFQLNSGVVGGGMYLSEDLEISVLNNRFLQNEANYGGGLLTNQTEDLIIEKNIFQFNSGQYGGGIYLSEDSVISIRNNKILQNNATDYGGGIVINITSPSIENNLVAGNTAWFGGGVAVSGTSNKFNDLKRINPLMMMAGGVGEFSSEGSIIKTSLTSLKKNTTLVCEPVLINNTIVDNSATAQGGGIYTEYSQPTVLNTILWGNTAAQDSQIYILSGDVFVVYSDVQDGYTGTGNIDLNPEFLDTTYFLLSNISPCIDTGNPDPIYNDAEDPNNTGFALWPSMGTIRNDMGAYGGPGTVNWIITYVDDDLQLTNEIPIGYQLSQNYPNPFNPSTTIEFALPTPGFVTLNIFNILGEKVATLVSENLTAGNYIYHWDAKGVTSGVYLYKLEAGNIILVRKMILIR